MSLPKFRIASVLAIVVLLPITNKAGRFLEYGPEALLWAPEANFEGELKRLRLSPAPFVFGETDRSQTEESAWADRVDLEAALRNSPEGERSEIIEDFEKERAKLAEYRDKKQYSFGPEPEFPVIHFPIGL